MGQSDWSNLSSGLTGVSIGPTAGTSPPAGGGTYAFGMKSVEDVAGAVGKYCLQSNFSPIASGKGGRITGALKRATLGSPAGFSPFLFFSAQGSGIADNAYVLGLSDEAACHIELRKGPIISGVPAVSLVAPAASPFVLMRSSATFAPDTWQHLRLDVIKQGTGDVVLQVFRSDLTEHNVDSPVWVAVPGMEGQQYPTINGFVDDALGVNTGSAPLSGGYVGFGCRFETANRAAYVDHVSVDRQL